MSALQGSFAPREVGAGDKEAFLVVAVSMNQQALQPVLQRTRLHWIAPVADQFDRAAQFTDGDGSYVGLHLLFGEPAEKRFSPGFARSCLRSSPTK